MNTKQLDAVADIVSGIMAESIKTLRAEMRAEVEQLKAELFKSIPQVKDGKDGERGSDGLPGKDCDMDSVKALVAEAVKSIEVIHGKDGANGKDGINGEKGEPGEKGSEGVGVADLMLDRDGALVATMTDGRMKSLGVVVGKDGADGKDGSDGIGLDSFEMEYMEETHEVRIKAACGGRVKELRYSAGGLRPAGYWRDGLKALAGQVYTHDGSGWVAKNATTAKPATNSEDWVLIARKGRDGERGPKGESATPPTPIKLKD